MNSVETPSLKALLLGGLVWDNHTCMPLRPGDETFLPQLARVRRAGIDVTSLNVAFGKQHALPAEQMLTFFREWFERRSDEYVLVHSVADVLQAQSSQRLGVCFDLEGMDALDGDRMRVHRFYELGVRWMLAAYNQPNAAGGGCLAEDDGLTPFGREVVAEMNAVGMVVCGSHCGYRTARELIDVSSSPVIFSHSNPLGMWNHPRNIPDDLMKACASRGGVIGINGFGPFLGDNDASILTYVNHIDYAVSLVGPEHVGIALDYVFDSQELDEYISKDPESFPPEFYSEGTRMLEPWRLPDVAHMLHARGYPISSLQQIFGENHLRVAKKVWQN
jgi:membrane dipeptidase